MNDVAQRLCINIANNDALARRQGKSHRISYFSY